MDRNLLRKIDVVVVVKVLTSQEIEPHHTQSKVVQEVNDFGRCNMDFMSVFLERLIAVAVEKKLVVLRGEQVKPELSSYS